MSIGSVSDVREQQIPGIAEPVKAGRTGNTADSALKARVDALSVSTEEKETIYTQAVQLKDAIETANVASQGTGKASLFNSDKVSIDTLLATAMLDRYAALQDLVKKQAETVKKLNDQLRAWGTLKAALAVYGNGVSDPDAWIKLDKPGSSYAELQNLVKDNGLDLDFTKFVDANKRYWHWTSDSLEITTVASITQGNLAKLMQQIDSNTTGATNVQNTEYNKLQDYAQKLTQALDLASTVDKKFFDTRKAMVNNIR